MAIAAGTFSWEWASNASNNDLANRLLGHSVTDTAVAAASIEGDLIPDMRLHTHILVRIPEEGSKNVTLIDGSEYSLAITVFSNFGGDLEGRKQQHYSQTITFNSNVSTINVELW